MSCSLHLVKDSISIKVAPMLRLAIMLAVLVTFSVLVTGCDPESEPASEPEPESLPAPPSAALNTEFQLKILQTAQVADGLAITFKRVDEDSRCPTDVQCVWAGQAIIVIEVVKDGENLGDSNLTLGTPDSEASRVNIPGYRIEALDLSPEPHSEGIAPSEYVVTLIVFSE
jgi:hypothetical protein